MTLNSEIGYTTRTAQVIANTFSTSGTDLYFYTGTMPTSGTLSLTGAVPQYANLAAYAAQLVGTSSNWAYRVTDGVLEFNPADYPPIVTVGGIVGTIEWCIMIGNSQPTDGSIIGSVSLSGGNGLVQIANDEAGGGSGLTVATGDNISVTSFGLKWEI